MEQVNKALALQCVELMLGSCRALKPTLAKIAPYVACIQYHLVALPVPQGMSERMSLQQPV